MSLHAQLSPEAAKRLQLQKRTSTIASIVISILTLVLLSLVLGLFLLQPSTKEIPVIITYKPPVEEKAEKEVTPKPTTQKPKPTSPSSSMARVITSTAPSPTSVPTPETITDAPSLDFGASIDFGDGWASEGTIGGGAKFFQQEVNAERIAYVIDYSQSMRGQRDKLMREELKKSISQLPPSIEYQMVFFAGPSWVAGDEVKVDRASSTIEHNGKTIKWVGKGAHDWSLKDDKEELTQPKWMSANNSQIKKSLELVDEHKLYYGTAWGPAVMMALSMDPAPQIIFFMTDGSAGPRSEQVAKELAEIANKKNVIINTIALMEPKAAKPMELLANETGGEFTMIGADGEPMNKKDDKK